MIEIGEHCAYNVCSYLKILKKHKVLCVKEEIMSETKELKYNEPWILQRADPYVYRHTDGNALFYRIAWSNGIALRRASTLARTGGC